MKSSLSSVPVRLGDYGLNKVSGEWALVCLAWNLKRMAVLRPKSEGIRSFRDYWTLKIATMHHYDASYAEAGGINGLRTLSPTGC